MKRLKVCIFFSFFCVRLFCQPFTISATISQLSDGEVYLAAIQGDTYQIIDSVQSNFGFFKFQMVQNTPAGVYTFLLNKRPSFNPLEGPERSVEFIFNNEDIKIKSQIDYLNDSLVFIHSTENQIYNEFLLKDKEYMFKLELLKPLLISYPASDTLSTSIKERYNQLQQERNNLIDKTIQQHPKLFSSKMINLFRTPFLDANTSEVERLDYLKNHYFDELNFNDEQLLNTGLYTSKSIQYLALFRDARYSRSMQEEEFCKASDLLLQNAKANTKAYHLILEYLMRGFEAFQFDGVLAHLADKYFDKGCSPSNSSMLYQRMEGYRKMAVGQKVPLWALCELLNWNEPVEDYLLVVYWASWCPHCQTLLPGLKEWTENNLDADIKIITISLDAEEKKWKKEIENYRELWVNVCDTLGWEGEAAKSFHVYATPSIYLLNKEGTIMAKPVSIQELLLALNNL